MWLSPQNLGYRLHSSQEVCGVPFCKSHSDSISGDGLTFLYTDGVAKVQPKARPGFEPGTSWLTIRDRANLTHGVLPKNSGITS